MSNPNEFTDIETALRRLAPRQPSEACRARIASAFGTQAAILPFPRIITWVSALATTACAAAFVLTRMMDTAPPASQSANTSVPMPEVSLVATYQPSGAPTNGPHHNISPRTISSIEPLDLRQTPDGRLFMPYRVRYVNTTSLHDTQPPSAYKNPHHSKGSTPAEEVHFVGFDMI